jgi:L-asparaginase
MRTRLIVTGGTLDKQYDPLTGELAFGDTHIPEMVAHARLVDKVVIEKVLIKESSDVTAQDRERIAAACQASGENRIVITHGTSTMVETAQMLAGAGLSSEKTIVLTGAIVPYSFGVASDAMFNLGAAMAYCAALPPGIYIAMHGIAFDPYNVRKNLELGAFTLID